MGTIQKENALISCVPAGLAAVLDIAAKDLTTRKAGSSGADLVVTASGKTFVVKVLANASAGPFAAHAMSVASAAKQLRKGSIPLLAVPFMSDAGRERCAAVEVSWFDFSGNARIVAPGIRIRLDGRPNRFRAPGRPSSVFAPKSARVIRWLLMHPNSAFTQREIARATDMSEGFVSRVVGRLLAESYLVRSSGRDESEGGTGDGSGFGYGDGSGSGSGDGSGFGYGDGSGSGSGDGSGFGYGDGSGSGSGDGSGTRHHARGPVRVRDASLLLAAWREEYQFSKHTITRGHIAARSGDAVARFVSDGLIAAGVEHAATGLAAAWQLTHFAAFRIATFFVIGDFPSELRTSLGFREVPRGANVWIATPNDSGVLQGAEERDGVRCVHPVQAYLDLKEHPERAAEAANQLRSELISWTAHV
jgi:hypothetical protein